MVREFVVDESERLLHHERALSMALREPDEIDALAPHAGTERARGSPAGLPLAWDGLDNDPVPPGLTLTARAWVPVTLRRWGTQR